MHRAVGWWLAVLAVSPAGVDAQAFSATLDPTTGRAERPTPEWVERLEADHGAPRCTDRPDWGRSTLDGALASRRRPDALPCRSVWESPVRLELGLLGGGLVERGDGAFGGLYGQLGLRFHEMFSAYWQLQLLGGGWDRGSGGVTVEGAVWNSVMLELSPHRIFGVALGPTIEANAACDVDVAQDPDGCTAGWGYGLSARLSLSLAQVDATGIALAADVHVSLADEDPRAVLLLGLGFRL